MMIWTAMMREKPLHWLCKNGNYVLCTGKQSFSHSAELFNKEISSVLYIPGNKGTSVDGAVTPYMDYSQRFKDIKSIEHSLSLRGLNTDLKEIVRKWSEWKELEAYKTDLETQREKVIKVFKTLENSCQNKDKMTELKESIQNLKQDLKAVTSKIWDIEESAANNVLSLPNNLHESTGDVDKVVFSLSKKLEFGFEARSHVDLGKKSGELIFIDNSPTSYYLKNRLSMLEFAYNDYFLSVLRESGFMMMSNCDFVKPVIIEGCGMHFTDRFKYNRLSTNLKHDKGSLHLVGGGSLQAFSAYFTKQIIEKTDSLPIKLATVGRNYSCNNVRHPGLLGCRQSSVVDGFILYENGRLQEKNIVDEVMVTIIQSYLKFGVHLQVTQYSARKLEPHESAALGFQMFSPHTGEYHEVARISMCGDYISKRLWTLCRKNKAACFVSILHIRACHSARLMALLVENFQDKDGTYTFPEFFKGDLDSL